MPSPEPVLELRAIEKIYGMGEASLRVLKGIDLSILEGEYVAIIGPSGSGKSTLLNLLGCLDRPTSGAYLLSGEDVAQFNDRELSRIRNIRIGFVFQSFHLISHLTVHENVELPLFYARMGRAERRKRCREVLERVGLDHRLDHIPAQLSGGERQRVAVARALSNNPALILADEPTGNLDSTTSAEIMDLFRELHGAGRTVVVITHDPEIAAAAPRRVLLRDGLIESDVAEGSVDPSVVRNSLAGIRAPTVAPATDTSS
ncbi:MAG: putative ABC transport system ATP-binding protein [Pseudohongiellaceae bacterium]